jgi:hypothetical protein
MVNPIPSVIFAPIDVDQNDASATPLIYPQWKDISVTADLEVTTKPSSAGSTVTLVRRNLPKQANGQIVIADNRTDDERTSDPSDYVKQKCAQLEAMRGRMVFMHSRTASFPGVIASVKFQDSGEWDNAVVATFEIKEILEANPDGTPVDGLFGEIRIPFKPEAEIGGGGAECAEGKNRHYDIGDFGHNVLHGTLRGIGHIGSALGGATGMENDEFGEDFADALMDGNTWKDVGKTLVDWGDIAGGQLLTAGPLASGINFFKTGEVKLVRLSDVGDAFAEVGETSFSAVRNFFSPDGVGACPR